MKRLLLSSAVLTIFTLAMTVFQISCKKDANAETPVALTKEAILVQKIWKVDQLHSVINGKYASYFNDGANSTGVHYELMRYTFKPDGTGTYIDEVGTSHTTSWEFTTADKRTVKFSVNSPSASVNIWQMVEIAGNYLHTTQNFTLKNDPNNIQSFRLVQMP